MADKKINNFKASWKNIDKVMHKMKGSLSLMYKGMDYQRKAMVAITDGLETLYKSINEMVNGNNKDEG